MKIKDFYRKRFDKSLQNAASAVTNKWLGNYTTAFNTWKRIESIRSLFNEDINQRGNSLRILDVGCGDALLIFMLNFSTNRFEYYGIDISTLDIAFAKKLKKALKADNVTLFVGNVEKLPFQDSSFDIIICSEVLEHLEHPEICLREIKRVLKNKGTALISTPNGGNLVTRLPKIFKKTQKESAKDILEVPKYHNHDEHINVRNIKAWKQTFLSLGFSITAIKRHGTLYGGYEYNKHRLLFAVIIFLDWILDHLPFMYNLSEGVTFKLKKSGQNEQ